MDILEVIKLDLHLEREKIQDLLELEEESGTECSPEALADLTDSVQSDRIAIERTLFENPRVLESFRGVVEDISATNKKIADLLSDLGQGNCAENGYGEGLSTVAAEIDTRNARVHQLFAKLQKELPLDERGGLLADYERLREYYSENDPFQETIIPSHRDDRQEENRFL